MNVNAVIKPELHTRWKHKVEDFKVDVLHVTQDDRVILLNPDGIAFDSSLDDFHSHFERDTTPSWLSLPKQRKCWECSGAGQRQAPYGSHYDECLTCRGTGYLPESLFVKDYQIGRQPRTVRSEAFVPADLKITNPYLEAAAEAERQDMSTPLPYSYLAWGIYWATIAGIAGWLAWPVVQNLTGQ